MDVWNPNLGIGKISNLNKILAFQNITLRKITIDPPFVSNLTLRKDVGIKTVEKEAAVFYKRFYIRLEDDENPLIKAYISRNFLEIPVAYLKKNGVEIFT